MEDETARLHILYAEDNLDLQKSNIRLLAVAIPGCEITAVADGQECLDVFKANPEDFRLILTDNDMPRKSGSEVTQELAQMAEDGWRIPPVIIYTGHPNAVELSEQITEHLRTVILKKPARILLLKQIIIDITS